MSLKEQWTERFQLQPDGGRGRPRPGRSAVRLAVAPKSVPIGVSLTEKDKDVIAEQAYRLVLVEAARDQPHCKCPIGAILRRADAGTTREDPRRPTPDFAGRRNHRLARSPPSSIYWDDAHHLEPLPILKQAVRQAAFYKVNGFAIKLEGHFHSAHAAPVVEPYAMTPAEFQELTDYAFRYHVQ